MKKILAMILIAFLVFTVCGCSSDKHKPANLSLSDPNERIISETIYWENANIESWK